MDNKELIKELKQKIIDLEKKNNFFRDKLFKFNGAEVYTGCGGGHATLLICEICLKDIDPYPSDKNDRSYSFQTGEHRCYDCGAIACLDCLKRLQEFHNYKKCEIKNCSSCIKAKCNNSFWMKNIWEDNCIRCKPDEYSEDSDINSGSASGN